MEALFEVQASTNPSIPVTLFAGPDGGGRAATDGLGFSDGFFHLEVIT